MSVSASDLLLIEGIELTVTCMKETSLFFKGCFKTRYIVFLWYHLGVPRMLRHFVTMLPRIGEARSEAHNRTPRWRTITRDLANLSLTVKDK